MMAKWADFETHPVGTAAALAVATDRIKELEAQVARQDYDVHPVEMAARIKELEEHLEEHLEERDALVKNLEYAAQIISQCTWSNIYVRGQYVNREEFVQSLRSTLEGTKP